MMMLFIHNLTNKVPDPQKIVLHKELKSFGKEPTSSLLKVGGSSQEGSGKRERT